MTPDRPVADDDFLRLGEEASLDEIAEWGPAEDWADWAGRAPASPGLPQSG